MNAVRTTDPLCVDVQIAADSLIVPDNADWSAWVGAALSAGGVSVSGTVTVRLVNEEESAALNLSYRNQPGATNVLAFPGSDDVLAELPLEANIAAELGDLVICLPVASNEAGEQRKSCRAHLAHLVVHGTLHLIGYDHQQEIDADRMESLEVRVMKELGFASPYDDSCADPE